MSVLYPCPKCLRVVTADEGHHLCRECEGYAPKPAPREDPHATPQCEGGPWACQWFDESRAGDTYGVRNGDGEVICYTSRTQQGWEDAQHIAFALNAVFRVAPSEQEQRTPPPLPDDERGPIFTEVPSALHIMHWFLDKQMAKEWVGCGGDADYILSWDPESETGCHLDLIAHVDHDASWYWLLSVGTQLDGGPTSYDLLFIAADLDGKRSCEWRNEPTAKQPWHYDGMVWFAGQIEESDRLAASRPDVAPQPAVVETPPDLADPERSEAPLTIHPPSYLAGWNDAKAGRQYGEGRVADVAPQPEDG